MNRSRFTGRGMILTVVFAVAALFYWWNTVLATQQVPIVIGNTTSMAVAQTVNWHTDVAVTPVFCTPPPPDPQVPTNAQANFTVDFLSGTGAQGNNLNDTWAGGVTSSKRVVVTDFTFAARYTDVGACTTFGTL